MLTPQKPEKRLKFTAKNEEIPDYQPRRSCRIVMRKSLDEFNSTQKDGEMEEDGEIEDDKEEKSVPTTSASSTKNVPGNGGIRRFQSKNPRIWLSRKRKREQELPTNYEELKQKTDKGEIPDTVFYRASSNSMYIPSITADMIQDNGTSLTLTTSSDDYFKYARVKQKTKLDHADPDKVFKIIDAVRNRPIIWDQRLFCHQSTSFIRRAWQQIDEELGPDDEYPLKRRKQIWKNKKDYFSFAANSENLSKWMFAEAMEFYRPMIKFRATVLLRPTVSSSSGQGPSTTRTTNAQFDKFVLANKTITCDSDDKDNVMTFLLKSIFDTGMANCDMMNTHADKILEIFQKNLKKLENPQ